MSTSRVHRESKSKQILSVWQMSKTSRSWCAALSACTEGRCIGFMFYVQHIYQHLPPQYLCTAKSIKKKYSGGKALGTHSADLILPLPWGMKHVGVRCDDYYSATIMAKLFRMLSQAIWYPPHCLDVFTNASLRWKERKLHSWRSLYYMLLQFIRWDLKKKCNNE